MSRVQVSRATMSISPAVKISAGLLENAPNFVIFSVDMFLYNQGVNFTCQGVFITVKVAVIV